MNSRVQVDIIVHNADVRTMGDPGDVAEALAIAGSKILAVGTNADILAHANSRTQVIDAHGATVLPGFVESHMHLFFGAFSRRALYLGDVTGVDALTKAVHDFAAIHPDEHLLIGQSAQYGFLGEGVTLDRHLLDEILPYRALVLQSSDFHNGWCNTKALEAAGLMHGADVGIGSEVVVGPDGLATGLLTEFAALAPVLALGRYGGRESCGLEAREPDETTAEQRATDKALLAEGMAYCASHGITTIVNMDGNQYQARLLAEMEQDGDLICRIDLPYNFTSGQSITILDAAEKIRTDLNSDMLWSNRIKVFMDGVLDMETAYRLSDYPGRPGHKSEPLHSKQAFADLAIQADRRKFQIAVHAIGDGAVRATLDGYEAALKANGRRDSRHRVEHIELIDPDDIPRFSQLGVVASVQPVHLPGCADFPQEPTVTLIGKAEWPNSYLWRTLKDAGAPICFSSDWPIANLAPLKGIAAAITRTPWSAELSDERLGFEETLYAFTAGGAFAACKEDVFGTIAAGMAADIVLLDREIAPENIGNAQVALTICNGRVTFSEASRV